MLFRNRLRRENGLSEIISEYTNRIRSDSKKLVVRSTMDDDADERIKMAFDESMYKPIHSLYERPSTMKQSTASFEELAPLSDKPSNAVTLTSVRWVDDHILVNEQPSVLDAIYVTSIRTKPLLEDEQLDNIVIYALLSKVRYH